MYQKMGRLALTGHRGLSTSMACLKCAELMRTLASATLEVTAINKEIVARHRKGVDVALTLLGRNMEAQQKHIDALAASNEHMATHKWEQH
jgi:hypothetical protein